MVDGSERVRYRRAEGVVWRRTQARVLTLAPAPAEPQQLDGAAAATWEALARPGGFGDLAQRIREAQGEVPDLEAFLREALRMLTEAGLVTSEKR